MNNRLVRNISFAMCAAMVVIASSDVRATNEYITQDCKAVEAIFARGSGQGLGSNEFGSQTILLLTLVAMRQTSMRPRHPRSIIMTRAM